MMSLKANNQTNPIVYALIGGAALGALAMSLAVPKTGKAVLDRFRLLVARVRSRAGGLDANQEEEIYAVFI